MARDAGHLDGAPREEGFVRSLLEAIPLPAFLISGDEKIEMTNAPGAQFFGDIALEGRHYMAVMRQPSLVSAIERALNTQSAVPTRYLRSMGDRQESFRVLVSPVAHGGPERAVIVTFEDVTDLHLAKEMRRDFVANVSHELKTPLTAMIGFIETLQGAASEDPAARARFLGIMGAEAERMNRLVADLLSLSRVESDERVRPTQTVSVSQLVDSTLRALRPLADKTDVTLDLRLSEPPEDLALQSTVIGDGDQLQQVFTNLIENAIKYGGTGGEVIVAVTVHRQGLGFQSGFVQVDVIDKGDGFDPVHIPRLTERFYRVDDHRSRGLGGTGLGLAIVKHIVNRHKGRLRIESALGKGARFSVLLPTDSPKPL